MAHWTGSHELCSAATSTPANTLMVFPAAWATWFVASTLALAVDLDLALDRLLLSELEKSVQTAPAERLLVPVPVPAPAQ